MTTKQQERETLKKISDLIAAAGPDSYIGMAFAGCVEMASENIENDFGNSWPERYEAVCRIRDELADARRRSDDALAAMEKRVSAQIAKKDEAIRQLDADLKAAMQKQIPADLYRDLWLMVEGRRCTAENEIEQEAELLARFADCPQDIAVGVSLKRLAAAKARRDEAASILERLEKYE